MVFIRQVCCIPRAVFRSWSKTLRGIEMKTTIFAIGTTNYFDHTQRSKMAFLTRGAIALCCYINNLLFGSYAFAPITASHIWRKSLFWGTNSGFKPLLLGCRLKNMADNEACFEFPKKMLLFRQNHRFGAHISW